MGLFTTEKDFTEGKKKTRAFREWPGNVREMLDIAAIYDSGIFRIEPDDGIGLYDSCYVFEDVNYINQDKPEKVQILNELMEWFKSMNVSYKITLANEYRNMEAFLKEIGAEKNAETYPGIAEGIGQWKREKLADGNPDVEKVLYLTLTCRAKNYQEAATAFGILDVQVQLAFQRLRSRVTRLNAAQRLKSLYAFFHPGREGVPYSPETLRYFPEDWKNSVLPRSSEQFKDYLVLGNLYVSVLFASQYDAYLDEGRLLSGLSRVPFPSIVTLDIAPVSRKALEEKLAAAYADNERATMREMEQRRKNGQFVTEGSYSKTKKKDELAGYRDQVADNDEGCIFLGLLMAVTAPTEELLAERIDLAKRLGSDAGVMLDTYDFRQLRALNTALPFGGRRVDAMRPLLTSSAVAFQPFYAQDVLERGGMVYGRNRTTKNLICGNRKKLKNPHGMIVGHSGSGKSMLIKLTEISQTLLGTDDDILMLDPQNECADICREYGGEYYDLSARSGTFLNPFEIPEEVFYEAREGIREEFVAAQADFAYSFCSAAMQNIRVTQEHGSVIGRCVRRMYARFLDRDKPGRQPVLADLRNEIGKAMEEADNENDRALCRTIYNSLSEYAEGSYDMFSKETNIDFRKRLVGIGLLNVSEKLWETVMITVMHFLTNRMEFNKRLQKATHFIVDETQVVCEHPASAQMLLRAVVTFRKFGGICTLALQNLKRALDNPALRDMFSNCEYKCFLDQGGIDAGALSQIQKLSDAEFMALNEDTPGYGVMVWGKKVLLFDARIDPENPLYRKFSTNFYEERGEGNAVEGRKGFPDSGEGPVQDQGC